MRGKRPGRKPTFNREQVVKAAIEEGLSKFTLVSVSKAMGISTSALYREFASREELVAESVYHAAKEFDGMVNTDANSWKQVLRDFTDASWELCEMYPGFTEVIQSYPSYRIFFFDTVRRVRTRLTELEIPGGEKSILLALDAITDMVLYTYSVLEAFKTQDQDPYFRSRTLHEEIRKHTQVLQSELWVNRGLLPAKLDFIIQGIEAGLTPDSVKDEYVLQ